jgi:mRNA-degrading endonuclease RelE of RelBE toxin-antitoxin system
MYQIKFSTQATSFIRSLSEDIQKRIKKKFKEISNNPIRYLEQYEGNYKKLRIGNYRTLVDIDNPNKILYVRVFEKRSRIYN